MLWYKSFRELRTITLVGIAAMAVACVFIVMYQQTMRDHADAPMTYIAYIWKSVYNSIGRDLFVILSIILGSGSLLQERTHGTAAFTLALPVSRRNIVFTRAIVGYLGVVIIASVPVLVLPIASRYVGQSYPVLQAVGFAALWAAAGAVFYGFSFLLSHYYEGDYISVLVAVPSLMLYGVLLTLARAARLHMVNIFGILNGEDMPFFNEVDHLLVAPLPWLTLLLLVCVSVTFVYCASRRIQPRDF